MVVLLVHGLGGSADSGYVRRAAASCWRQRVASLRINLRGADRTGEDIYHAGLVDDLRAAIACPEITSFKRVAILGFSLGGHTALRLAADGHPRLGAVVAVCSPLDLAAAADHIDGAGRTIYRRHLLAGLREIHASAARRGRAPGSAVEADAARISSLREWDDRIVAPRFGFRGAADYYRRAGVGSRLGEISIPALIFHTADDPMISSRARAVRDAGPSVEHRIVARGGHLGFRPRARIDDQLVDWLRTHAR